ncbi:universal stress protein [Poritiphilus flavus]|uniref:Universal stress protein n=1 Tax=Poritiphilus flavus TaxID=2697053 RepID=A0A6L9EBY9_9FLAO|nr:universal stress protein [Poritiphilus flavus]NAS11929.1 universal stress protein [Poritiphilus flavus]
MLRVLLPTDFSDNSLDAIRYGLQLLKDQTCTFFLLHTYTPAIYRTEYVLHSPGQIGLGDIYQTDSMTQLEGVQQRLTEEFRNPIHSFVCLTAFNTLLDEVREISENEQIDLIIMGTQGASGAKEIFLGTHTVHVIKRSNVPVLAIPPGCSFVPPRKILFPTDFEIDYGTDQLEPLLNIARLHESMLDVLYISYGYDLSEAQMANQEKLGSMLQVVPHRFHDLPNQTVIQGINSFQDKNKSDFLVMIRNKHTFVERLFIEPVIKKIGFHVTIPFLVLPFRQNS